MALSRLIALHLPALAAALAGYDFVELSASAITIMRESTANQTNE